MTFVKCDGRTERSMRCSLLDLSSCRKEGFQANPGTSLQCGVQAERKSPYHMEWDATEFPITKKQIPNKFQIQNLKTPNEEFSFEYFGFWILGIVWLLYLVIWLFRLIAFRVMRRYVAKHASKKIL